jgi:hypothetical protein
MSKLTDTKRAFDHIAGALDQEIRKGGARTKELERFRETLQVAFYLLAWAQFEHLVRAKSKDVIEGHSRAHTPDGHAWRFLKQNAKSFTVRKQLELIFDRNQPALAALQGDYEVRNDVAHNYKNLPREARDISEWMAGLEQLIDRF